ncbi:MAG: hypothetical protein NC918_00915 [Candidatus Omnitrophica bacterium]|nr:hypothetical protein [Candidatus Omnitrophota bacterium]
MKEKIYLKIADVVVLLESKFRRKKADIGIAPERFRNFFCKKTKPDIKINIQIVKKFPKIFYNLGGFSTIHPQDSSLCWQWEEKKNYFIFRSLVEDKFQLGQVKKDFKNVKFFVLPEKNKFIWLATDVIYDFLQILFLVYFAKTKRGLFLHATGINLDGKGFVFVGKSGTGKTTLAKLFNRYSCGTVLNDDRIIVRKNKEEFFIYGCPWHGAFSDYLKSKMQPTPLERIFFIYPAKKNILKRLNFSEAFKLFYPAIFPVFWDRDALNNIFLFLEDLLENIECFSLGFKKTQEIIKFFKEKCIS